MFKFDHKEMDQGDLREAYERVKGAYTSRFDDLVKLGLDLPGATITYINEELYDPQTEESLYETHCFVSLAGPDALIQPCLAKITEANEEVGSDIFKLEDKCDRFEGEREKEYYEFLEKAKKQYEEEQKKASEEKKAE